MKHPPTTSIIEYGLREDPSNRKSIEDVLDLLAINNTQPGIHSQAKRSMPISGHSKHTRKQSSIDTEAIQKQIDAMIPSSNRKRTDDNIILSKRKNPEHQLPPR